MDTTCESNSSSSYSRLASDQDNDSLSNQSQQARQVHIPNAFNFKASHYLKATSKHQQALCDKNLDYFSVFVGPAAGPRAFVSAGFERQLKQLLNSNKIVGTKWLVGGSTGALRFMAFVSSLVTNRDLTAELKEHYCQMYYKQGDTPAILQSKMDQVYHTCAPLEGIAEALEHPTFKLAIIVASVSPWFIGLPDIILRVVYAGFFLGNMISPNILSFLCQRICFYTGPDPPVFLNEGQGGSHGIRYCKLTSKNLHQVLRATTAVPFIQERCEYIDGVGKGLFVDGALTDYYLNSHFTNPALPALLLADSQDCKVYRTIFDCYLPLPRTVPESMFENCSAIYPTSHFISELPERRLPSMSDWFHKEYILDPERRRNNWRRVFELSEDHWPLVLENINY
ncbi:hypothetical protein BASA50_010941 [Batrachochytrium salamandrivorans]|uniref:PNPLA domain-containing protein n=1 Tax=Batrachochytrium salamandrivorans TaxID=1357716 RepID=A0ABQ8EXA0_9FUNG|nr:hypothetical protein BASA50_010941 [Batrachochytrium salamandrivorans]KAJ1327293.1 hypothetical protein BSLG_010635 [Batrachochytrium salamandrivorans]